MTNRLKEIRERHDIADCQYIFGNEGRDSLLSLLWEAHPDRGELLSMIESLDVRNRQPAKSLTRSELESAHSFLLSENIKQSGELAGQDKRIEELESFTHKLESARTNDANTMLSLRRRLVQAENIPQKEKEPTASAYQKGWIAGWNGCRDELKAMLKEKE